MDLLERDDILGRLGLALDRARDGSGRIALVRGEAGIGKTTVVRFFTETARADAHVLWGGCDDLLTPRPLGPVWDMAFDEPDLASSLREDDRQRTFGVMLELLGRALRPTMVVIEDVHWADEATLDLIKFLGRRIDRTHALLVLTYRDGAVSGDHPLRLALGDLPYGFVETFQLKALSREGVLQLAGDREDAGRLWEVSGGNPFFVTELLAAQETDIPPSIRDALRARVLRLSEAGRHLVEMASVVPGRIEIQLARDLLGDVDEAMAECEEAGILQLDDDALAFRHELARQAVYGDLTDIRRRQLNLKVLQNCETRGEDPARCAHHARQAADEEAILRLLPAAARRAAELESHQEAVSHLRALEPYLDAMSDADLADHYDLWVYEEYLAGGYLVPDIEEMVDEAIRLRRRLGDPAALGNTLLVASRIAWVNMKRASAIEYASEAASVLEAVGGEELAMAYSTLSQLAMLGNEEARTIEYGDKALAHVGDGPSRARIHVLNNVGSVRMINRFPEGREEIEESYRMAGELGLAHEQARAAVNLAWGFLAAHEADLADPWLGRAAEIMQRAEMPAFESYVLAMRSMRDGMLGRYTTAETSAQEVLEGYEVLETSMAAAAISLARVYVRQGAPEAKSTVFDAWERAVKAGEIQRLGPAGSVMAEYAWLGGSVDDRILDELEALVTRCSDLGAVWMAADLAQWLYLLGKIEAMPPAAPDPYLNLVEGDWDAAARFWASKQSPYEQAVALTLGDDEAKLEALRMLDDLGAVPLASRIRSELQAEGVKGIPRGPQRATKESPLGLTARQTDVLELLAEGLTNAEIADRLFLSTRTVDHHVSAILSRTGAEHRTQAVEIARSAGLIG